MISTKFLRYSDQLIHWLFSLNNNDQSDYQTIRNETIDKVSEFENQLSRAGVNSVLIKQAKFGLVAFIDEYIISSGLSFKDQWISEPLQYFLYKRTDAGELFFEAVEKKYIKSTKYLSLLKFFYFLMELGFRGKYLDQDNENYKLLRSKVYNIILKYDDKKKSAGRLYFDLKRTIKQKPFIKPEYLVWGAAGIFIVTFFILLILSYSASQKAFHIILQLL